jgi:biofilm PGA synthesis N-glycosyltransferase PgaC
MLVVKVIILFSLFLYLATLLYAAISFVQAPSFSIDPSVTNHTKTCIVICARNEEKTISSCLKSILEQSFDSALLEIILINDASSDTTLQLAESILRNSGINYRIISNPTQEGKKNSITKAITYCNSELIITRDADTYTTTKNWLRSLVTFHEQTKREFIIAPVGLKNSNSFIGQLQVFENDALAIITGGFVLQKHPFLCNGANLCFTKQLFQNVNGYSSHQTIASGDDVFFLMDVKKLFPGTIAYLKQEEAVVYTYPLLNLKDVILQKVRWASKFGANPDPLNKFTAVLVFFIHLFTLFFLSKALFTGHLHAFGLFFIFSRFLIDFLLLFLASRYFKKAVSFWLAPVWLGYSFFVLTVGVLSWFYKPKWK